MPEDLFHRIAFDPVEDYMVVVQVNAVERREENLLVYANVQIDEDPDLPQDILITCRSWTECNVAPQYYEGLGWSQDHVVLWHYNQTRIISSFNGRADDPSSVAVALYERHFELVSKWIPIWRYLNMAFHLSELLGGGYGMLAEGPERLVLAYEEVMSTYGVPVSHHQSAAPQNKSLSVLFFDESYVIAEHFSAEAI